MNHVSKIVCNLNSTHSVLNANSKLICATCHECLFDVIHDLCVRDYLDAVNARVKSQYVKSRNTKSKKKKMWKPTGKVYTNLGYRWKPTGRIFTIDGNTCPLTRIISTKVVPPRKSISTTLVKQTQPSSNKSGNLKDITNVESSSKSNTVGSKISNHSEPMQNWGSNVFTAPSSSRVNFKSFGNDQIAKIMGYGDHQLRNVTISGVYYVEGLKHNLFSVGQLCDLVLEVAFRKHTWYVRNLDVADLLSGSRDTNLYTILLNDMMKSSPIFLISKALKTKSWLWHRRLSQLNFSTLNQLAKQGLVRGLPKMKCEKDHLWSACSLGKSKKFSHKPKADDTNQEKLYLLHMDLCGSLRVESINGKKYILVIVDDYLRFMWVKFLRSNDEAPEVIIKCLKQIQVGINVTVCNIRTDNRTKFVNQTLKDYYENVGISHQTFVARTPQHKSVVERWNHTLVEATCTMLIFSKAPFEDLGKLKPKADIGIFFGCVLAKKAYRIYNKITRQIMETIHVTFDDLTTMASEQFSSGPTPQLMTLGTLSSGLVPNPPSSTPFPTNVDRRPDDPTGSLVLTSLEHDAPSASTSSNQEHEQSIVISKSVEEKLQSIQFDNTLFQDTPSEESYSNV
ncbi:retrovirus-related pol polyprotein from transposon TNT 1-94 [Tanacetum coccineum]